MKYLKERFGDKLSKKDLESIVEKGIFPYSWFDNLEKLEQKEFPEIEDFFNDLTKKPMKKNKY